MDNLFYRKERRKSPVRAFLQKRLSSRRTVLGLLIGVPLALYLVFGSHGILQRVTLHQKKVELEKKIEEAEREAERLQAESKALEGDRKAIEKVAREKYGMVREGETVYRVNRDR